MLFIAVPFINLINPAQAASTNTEQEDRQKLSNYFEEALKPSQTSITPIEEAVKMLPRFGMDFFEQNTRGSVGSADYAPITSGYLIGPGDEIAITLWGIPEEGIFSVRVNRDGKAIIPHIGAIPLAGHTLDEARKILYAHYGQYYNNFQLEVSMGSLRSMTVYVTGNVKRPGSYLISSLSNLLDALMAAGGPTEKGSLRRIEIRRKKRAPIVFDMYVMLLRGDKTYDIRLEAGDMIFVPPVGPLVSIVGEVNVPAVYELNGAVRVRDLLQAVEALTPQTFTGRIQFYRINNHTYRNAFEGSLAEIEETFLADGDVLRLFPIFNITTSVTINGEIAHSGRYAIKPGRTKISELISLSGGLKEGASDKAYVTRITPTPEGPVRERFKISLSLALQGDPDNDMMLEPNDNIDILVIPEWGGQQMVTIEGEVANPGRYAILKGERISDLIKLAGGFTKNAFARGAVFTRISTAEEQKKSLQQMADQMERDMLETFQNTITGNNTNTNNATAGQNQEVQRRRELINRLRNIEIMGRMIVKIDNNMKFADSKYDLKLQDGDKLIIPEVPDSVNVMGAVYIPSSHVYNDKMAINDYINDAGGAVRSAHKRMLYLLKMDGTAIRLTRSTGMFSDKQWKAVKNQSYKIEPGDVIVVPVKYVNQYSLDLLKDTIDIIYKVALSVGVLLPHI
ncbi:MAG: SLBB domain-containing protein [Synergistaceae bacterium]|nr:SLBB domain-containing protein [Synergistaceae bacterium]